MRLYYLLFLVAFVSCVVAQTCVPLNASFTNPAICKITYNVPQQFNNNTEGDELYTFFNSLNTTQRPSRKCATALSTYYCGIFYPECSGNTTKPSCANQCYQVLTDCTAYADLFNGTAIPLPTEGDCNALSHTDCSSPTVDMDALYTNCNTTDKSKFDVNSPSNIICNISKPVLINGTASYNLADKVWLTFQNFAKYYGDLGVNVTQEPCMQSMADFYCSMAFTSCPAGEDPRNVQQVCYSACRAVSQRCSQFAQIFAQYAQGYQVPELSYCQTFPNTSCYAPVSADQDLSFFFGSTDQPTIAPTVSTIGGGGGSTTVVYPPGGAGKGAGLGVGVLFGLLIIIAVLMLIMKKQDSR